MIYVKTSPRSYSVTWRQRRPSDKGTQEPGLCVRRERLEAFRHEHTKFLWRKMKNLLPFLTSPEVANGSEIRAHAGGGTCIGVTTQLQVEHPFHVV